MGVVISYEKSVLHHGSINSSNLPSSSTNRYGFPVLLAQFWAILKALGGWFIVWESCHSPNWFWTWIETLITPSSVSSVELELDKTFCLAKFLNRYGSEHQQFAEIVVEIKVSQNLIAKDNNSLLF